MAFEPRDLVLQRQFALLQTLDLQHVDGRMLQHARDHVVEIAVLDSQLREFAADFFEDRVVHMRRNITGPGAAARAADLWRFALAFYARPGVAEACLDLQDRKGVDVPLLLACLWLVARGHGAPDRVRWRAISRDWAANAVRPLRALRRRLKGRAGWETIRTRVKRLELAAERAELVALAAATGPGSVTATDARAVLRSVLGAAADDRAMRKILAEAAKMRSASTPFRDASKNR